MRYSYGGGVMKHTTAAMIAFFVCAAGAFAALQSNPLLAIAAVFLLLVALLVYLIGSWRFADKHPHSTALGGSEFLRMQELGYAALGYPIIPASQPTTDPRALPEDDSNDL